MKTILLLLWYKFIYPSAKIYIMSNHNISTNINNCHIEILRQVIDSETKYTINIYPEEE